MQRSDELAVIEGMKEAMKNVTAGYVSPSIRDAEINGVQISKGDTIGIIEKEIVVSESDKMNAVYSLAIQMLKNFNISSADCNFETKTFKKHLDTDCFE